MCSVGLSAISEISTPITVVEFSELLLLFRENKNFCLWRQRCEQTSSRKGRGFATTGRPALPCEQLSSSALPGASHPHPTHIKPARLRGRGTSWCDHRQCCQSPSPHPEQEAGTSRRTTPAKLGCPSAALRLGGGGFQEIHPSLQKCVTFFALDRPSEALDSTWLLKAKGERGGRG